MKILVISDATAASLYDNFNKERYQDIDCVISCGDLPLYYLNFIIDAINVPCFYVPGNHDKTLSEETPAGWVNLHENVVEFKGLVLAGIGGSPFYNGESEFQYSETEIYWKYLKLKLKLLRKNKLDVFVSHSPAFGLGDIADSRCHQGFKTFNRLLDVYSPKLFLYGHAHLAYGVKRISMYQQTLLINGFRQYRISWDDVDYALRNNTFEHCLNGG